MATMTTLCFTGDENANRFISTNPLALVIGMLLDQQVPMERAFAAPYELSQRMVALLGKQLGVRPAGWDAVAGSYGLPGHRSVAT